MNSVFKALQMCVSFLLIHNQGFSQVQEKQYRLRELSDEKFDLAFDSIKQIKGSEYRFGISVCSAISPEDKKEIISNLKQGLHPDFGELEIFNYAEYAFGPGKASVQSDNIIVCFSELDEYGEISVRTISGDLELNPRQKEERRQAMIDLGMDATEFPDKKDSCYFFWLKDTIFSNGNYLHYEKTRTELNIEWGNTQSFKRVFPETFDCSDGPLGLPDFDWASDQFIGLRIGCGTQCWASYILPLNPNDSIQFIWYPLAINQETNMLAHIDDEERDKLILTQLSTGISRQILLDYGCTTEGVGACLKEVRLTTSELYFEYEEWVNAPPVAIYIQY